MRVPGQSREIKQHVAELDHGWQLEPYWACPLLCDHCGTPSVGHRPLSLGTWLQGQQRLGRAVIPCVGRERPPGTMGCSISSEGKVQVLRHLLGVSGGVATIQMPCYLESGLGVRTEERCHTGTGVGVSSATVTFPSMLGEKET